MFFLLSLQQYSVFYLPSPLLSFSTPYDDSLANRQALNKTWSRRDIHVLVDAWVQDLGLCKTLLSAVVQGYPPPILVGYHNEPGRWDAVEFFKSIRETMIKPRTGEDDLILWLGRNHWAQLPVDITTRRFLQYANVLAGGMKQFRRRKKKDNGTFDGIQQSSGAGQLVLLRASKACLSQCRYMDILLASVLPRDIYGPWAEQHGCQDLRRPQYIAPESFMGRAFDIVASVTDMIYYGCEYFRYLNTGV